jgi:hypothetical protein
MAKFDRLCIVLEGMEDVSNMIPITLYSDLLSLLRPVGQAFPVQVAEATENLYSTKQ